MIILSFSILYLVLGMAPEPVATNLPKITVEPTELHLTHQRFGHRLLVTRTDPAGRARDLTSITQWISDNPRIADVQGGLILPHGDGETVVRAQIEGQKLEVPVRVKGLILDPPVSLRLELEPMLTRVGCNSGACHGAQHGKGDLKLSLFGADASADQNTLARESLGRRVNFLNPGASLVLLKPTGQVIHEGGKRLERGSRDCTILEKWIAGGCPDDQSALTPRITHLQVLPRERTYAQPNHRQQLLVLATFSDGSRRDVTADARYDSNTPNLVIVDRTGLATTLDRGEGIIMVRYLGLAAVSRLVTIPDDPRFTWSAPPSYNYIDDHIDTKLRAMRYLPAKLCTDEEFLRRATLDASGSLPRTTDVEAFLADPAPSREKRQRYVEDLLNRPEFALYWTLQWDDWLHNFGRFGTVKQMYSLRNWVQNALQTHLPLDQMVSQLITSRGNTYRRGEANFYRLHQGSENLAEAVAGIFLGIRLECAKCHQHPFERWTQDDYYGLAAYFARVGQKSTGEFGPVRGIYGNELEILVTARGEVRNPRSGKIKAPTPLGVGLPVDDPVDRRRALARWLTDSSNPLLARNLVNRHWAHFMGRGLVEPIDDLRDTNPPTNPELLDALTQDLINHHYDLRHLLRTIMNSRSYQLSSRAVPGSENDHAYHSHYYPRRLSAEAILDAVCQVTGVPEKFAGMPSGTRAIGLPSVMSADVKSYFLDVFGRPQRTFDKCECVRPANPNLAQVLHLMNGEWLHNKVSDPKGRLAQLIQANKSDGEIIQVFYTLAFGRRPGQQEIQDACRFIAQSPGRKEGLEDFLWTLCNCKEFLFNH